MSVIRSIKIAAVTAAILFVGLVYFYRPDHKYRLTVEVDTPQGLKSAAGVFAVYRDKISVGGIGGGTSTKGNAIFLDLGAGRNLVAILGHGENGQNVDGMNQLAMDAFAAVGEKVQFKDVKYLSGTVPVTGNLIPTLVTFTNLSDPLSARVLDSADIGAVVGAGYRLRGVSLTMIPVGFWPIDFGGLLGEPITRGIETKLPFLVSQKNALRRIIDDMPPRFQPHYHSFER